MGWFNHQLEIFIPPSNDHDVIVTPLTTWQVVNCVVSIGGSLVNASYSHEATCIIPKLFPRSHVPIPQVGYVIGFLEGSLRRFGPPRFCKNLHWWESSTFLRWTSPKLSKGWSRGLRADGFFFHDWKRRHEWWDPLNLIWTNGSPIIILCLRYFRSLGERWLFHIESLDQMAAIVTQWSSQGAMNVAFFHACMISLNLQPSRYVPYSV